MLNHSPDGTSSEEGSPSTIDARQLDVVHEEENESDIVEKTFPESGFPVIPQFQSQNQDLLLETPQHQQGPEHRRMSLAAELGVESPPDVVNFDVIDEEQEQEQEEPSKKKRKIENYRNGERVMLERDNGKSSAGIGTRAKKSSVRAGGKTRQKSKTITAGPKATSRGGGVVGNGVEKENVSRGVGIRSSSSSATTSRAVGAKGARMTTSVKVSAGTSSKGGTSIGATGPRRVPINSVEAPAIHRNS